jgi:predicted transcriptional regulator
MQEIYINQELLSQIDAFRAKTGMSAAAFGEQAANDRSLVYAMRRGREPRYKTRSRILEFIAKNTPSKVQDPAKGAT